jgi:thioester reductase-like protein/aryl carrier-like protein
MEESLDQPGISNDDNFFAIGTDSLRALNVARKLRNIFKISEITVSTIYSNPSVTQLSEVICTLQINRQAAQTLDKEARKETLASLLDVYRAKVHEIPASSLSQKGEDSERQNVVLTGTTGTLGTYLLDSLLQNATVDHVYCLNRRINAHELYLQHSKRDGGEVDQKATFLQADFSSHQLGLDQHKYDLIRERATVIIHNAWPVNFNLSLETFRPQLTGLVELLGLAAGARHRTQFLYVSSISSVLGIRNSSGITPETIITNTDAPFSNGYAESKFISEILCEEASRHLEIPVSIARVGQIAGPVLRSGTVWNPTEWFPSLMVSSIKLGLLPDSLGASMNRIDWIPVDLLSEIMVELSLPPNVTQRTDNNNNGTCKVFHLVNPSATTWSTVLPAAQALLEDMTARPVRLVPASSWLGSLQRDVESIGEEKMEDGAFAALVRTHPAIKLFSFFATVMTDNDDGTNRLDITNTLDNSSGISQLASVGEPWLRKWIEEWLPLTKA